MNLESLNRKIYGVPIWVWAVGTALLVLLIYRYMRNRAGGGTASVSPLAVVRRPVPASPDSTLAATQAEQG